MTVNPTCLAGAAVLWNPAVVRACRVGYMLAAELAVPAETALIYTAWRRADITALAYCLHRLSLLIADPLHHQSMAVEVSLVQLWQVQHGDY